MARPRSPSTRQALRSVRFTRSPLVPGARTVSFAVANASPSNTATKALALSAAPVVSLPGGSLAYTEGDGARALDAGATIGDADSARLTGLTVALGAGYERWEDALAASVAGTALSATWDFTSGVLSIDGDDTVANYQRVLRTVTYENSSLMPSTASRTVTVTADDGALSGSATTTIALTAVDTPPILTTSGGPSSYSENDAAVVVDRFLTVSDVDSPTMSGAVVALATALQRRRAGVHRSERHQRQLRQRQRRADAERRRRRSPPTRRRCARSAFRTAGDGPGLRRRGRSASRSETRPRSARPTDKNVAVTAVDDAPTVSSGATLAYTENDAATAIDPALAVSDPGQRETDRRER